MRKHISMEKWTKSYTAATHDIRRRWQRYRTASLQCQYRIRPTSNSPPSSQRTFAHPCSGGHSCPDSPYRCGCRSPRRWQTLVRGRESAKMDYGNV